MGFWGGGGRDMAVCSLLALSSTVKREVCSFKDIGSAWEVSRADDTSGCIHVVLQDSRWGPGCRLDHKRVNAQPSMLADESTGCVLNLNIYSILLTSLRCACCSEVLASSCADMLARASSESANLQDTVVHKWHAQGL